MNSGEQEACSHDACLLGALYLACMLLVQVEVKIYDERRFIHHGRTEGIMGGPYNVTVMLKVGMRAKEKE